MQADNTQVSCHLARHKQVVFAEGAFELGLTTQELLLCWQQSTDLESVATVVAVQ